MRGGWCHARQAGFATASALAALLLAPSALLSPLSAQTPTTTEVPGFGVRYQTPAGWTLSGQEGRIQAWSTGSQTEALVFYAGHFSPIALALGDAQRVLGVPPEEDTRVVTPLTAARFGTHDGLAGSVRIVGARSVLAHVAVVQLNDSTVLGAVALLEGTAHDSVLARAVRNVATVLSSASVQSPTADGALAAQLTGAWEVQTVGTSGAAGGGFTNEESWTFAADGTFSYRKRFSVSLPGAAVTPEDRNDTGRWYAVGGAVVLLSEEGRLTVDVQLRDGKLHLDGTTFSRR